MEPLSTWASMGWAEAGWGVCLLGVTLGNGEGCHSQDICVSGNRLAELDTDWQMYTLFAAPEVVGRQRYGRPVDCWAIGVIMYIL